MAKVQYYSVAYFNRIPGYEANFKSVNTVTPILNIFPGQKVQLDFNTVKYTPRENIEMASWKIKSKNFKGYDFNGLRPIITVPPGNEGLFNLYLTLKLRDESLLHGVSNIYVVQEKPKIIVLEKMKQIAIPQSSLKYGVQKNNFIGTNGTVEVYSGNNQWSKKALKKKGDTFYLNLKEGETISPVDGSLILRKPNNASNLKAYGSVPMDLYSK